MTLNERRASASPLSTATRRGPRRRAALLVAAAAAAVWAGRASADPYYLNHAGAADWNSTADPYFSWQDLNTHANFDLPPIGATVDVEYAGPGTGVANTTLNLNYAYGSGTNGIGSLYVDSNNTVSQTSSTSALNATFLVEVGYQSSGAYDQSAGSVNVGNTLYVGVFSGTGTYNLSGGSLTAGGVESIGWGVTGVFNHSGGANNTQTLSLGTVSTANSFGTYNMSNGASLNVSHAVYVGDASVGAFNMTGGSVSMPTNAAGLFVGNAAGSSGTVTISGGTLNIGYPATQGGPCELVIGSSGSGQVVQSGGALFAGHVRLGNSVGASGSYTLSAGTLSSDELSVGEIGAGSFSQTGGNNTTGRLAMGSGANPSTFTLGGGTLSVVSDANVANNGEFIGLNYRNAVFTQSGGTHSIATGLFLGGWQYATGAGTYNLSDGLLQLTNGANETIAVNGASTGAFNQTGGTHLVSGSLIVSQTTGFGYGAATYNLGGGLLNAATVIVNPGGLFNQTGGTLDASQFTLAGGTVTGTLQNLGAFTYQTGNFAGRLLNQGTLNLGTLFTAGNGIENDTGMTIPTGTVITADGAGFDNLGTLNLQLGGTIGGSGLVNDYGGVMSGAGSVTCAFTNNGQLNLAGVLTVAGPMNNAGVINVSAGQALRSTSPSDVAVVNLPGGVIQGGGSISNLSNNGGLVYANSATPLVLTTLSANDNGGELRVADNASLTIVNPFTNAATVTLEGVNASLNGGAMSSAGTITGAGRVTNPIINTGVIQPAGGKLTFAAAGALNAAGGQIQVAGPGNAASFPQGLTNAGTVALNGGTLDTGSATLTNTGQVLGNGSLTTAAILNSGTVSLSDVNSFVYGSLTNTGSLKITANTTTFYGPVVNNGAVKTTGAVARFLAAFVNNGTYSSDPSDQSFTDLTIGAKGVLLGGRGDRFTLTGSFRSASARPDAWDTRGATLAFVAGGPSDTHDMDVGGINEGGFAADNYTWGTLDLGPDQTLVLNDGDATAGGALYASVLQLDGAPGDTDLADYIASHLLNDDAADPMNVYYDPAQPANAYLADATYALGNGGVLAPASATPEPASAALCLTAAWMGLAMRRRRARTAN